MSFLFSKGMAGLHGLKPRNPAIPFDTGEALQALSSQDKDFANSIIKMV